MSQVELFEGEIPPEEAEANFLEPRGIFDKAIIGADYHHENVVYDAHSVLSLIQEIFELSYQEANQYLAHVMQENAEKPIILMWQVEEESPELDL